MDRCPGTDKDCRETSSHDVEQGPFGTGTCEWLFKDTPGLCTSRLYELMANNKDLNKVEQFVSVQVKNDIYLFHSLIVISSVEYAISRIFSHKERGGEGRRFYRCMAGL